MKKSSLIHIQVKDNLVIFTRKIDTLIPLSIFLKKCKKDKNDLYIRMKEVSITGEEQSKFLNHLSLKQ